jgi:hypothetical protein
MTQLCEDLTEQIQKASVPEIIIPFQEFPKIARLSRECIISEKIDGTNGQIFIEEDGGFLVGSRTRWITPENDNHGFARWAYEHKDELMKLGTGRHYGEWWGCGIQRGYGLTEKRFSLFNTIRWCMHDQEPKPISTSDSGEVKMQERLPKCCHLVPVLYRGVFDTGIVRYELSVLQAMGSVAALGFMKPEGVVVFHIAGNVGFKKTVERDEEPKSTGAKTGGKI